MTSSYIVIDKIIIIIEHITLYTFDSKVVAGSYPINSIDKMADGNNMS